MAWSWHVAIGRQKVCMPGFCWSTLRERDHLENIDVDGNITLKWIFKTWDGRRGLGYLAQDRDRWLALVNVTKSFQVQ